jgi:ArsR family transcriptional regulator
MIMSDRLGAAVCARKLKTLSHALRLKMIDLLRNGELEVQQLARRLRLPGHQVSHHLAVLVEGGFVWDQRRGQRVFYALRPDVYLASGQGPGGDHLDLGCCRLELPPSKEASDRTVAP